jgi:hypothetical protein
MKTMMMMTTPLGFLFKSNPPRQGKEVVTRKQKNQKYHIKKHPNLNHIVDLLKEIYANIF